MGYRRLLMKGWGWDGWIFSQQQQISAYRLNNYRPMNVLELTSLNLVR